MFEKKKSSKNIFDKIAIILIGLYISSFAIFLTKLHLYWAHFFEYYIGSLYIPFLLKKFHFFTAYQIIFAGFSDKILYLRPIILFLFFKPSQYLYFFANIILNSILLFILYKLLIKEFSKEKSLFFIALTLVSNFFILNSLSYYVNSNFFLIYAILFTYLLLFFERKSNNFIGLCFLIFLTYLTKNITLILIPIILVTLFILNFKNDKRRKKTYYILLASMFGFSMYILSSNIITDLVSLRLISFFEQITKNHFESHIFLSKEIIQSIILFISNIRFNFLIKFSSIPLSILLYLSLFFSFKNSWFWKQLFLASEIYLFIINNFSKEVFQIRFYYPFYSIYFILLINELFSIIHKLTNSFGRLSKIIRLTIPAVIICFILWYNISPLAFSTNIQQSKEFSQLEQYSQGLDLFSVPSGSKIFVISKLVNSSTTTSCIHDTMLFFSFNKMDDETVFQDRLDKAKNHYILSTPRLNFTVEEIESINNSKIKSGSYILIDQHEIINESEYFFIQNYSCLNYCSTKLYLKI